MKSHLSDLFILEQVYDSNKKPYRIITGIVKKFDTDYRPSTGMIYPALKRLTSMEMIVKKDDGYAITRNGIEYFDKNKENYRKMVDNFTENKIFFKNMRKSIRNLIDTLRNSEKDYINKNQAKIIECVDDITAKIRDKKI